MLEQQQSIARSTGESIAHGGFLDLQRVTIGTQPEPFDS
jgi:hypothetical protein